MNRCAQALVILLLIALMGIAALSGPPLGAGPRAATAGAPSRLMWDVFQFGLPLVIGTLLATGMRWVLMAAVMYGTVGLALDIATVVQDFSPEGAQRTVLVMCRLTGPLNVLLIMTGGYGFLQVGPGSTPQEFPPPNPPSPPEA